MEKMATFRKIHVSFWSDTFVESLTPEQKYFFLYLLTNERTKMCGIYELSKRQAAFDTGYNIETVQKLINFFVEEGRVAYSEKSNEVAITNWLKYNDYKSPKVISMVKKDLLTVKDKDLIQYVNGINTVSNQEKYSIDTVSEQEKYSMDTVSVQYKNGKKAPLPF